MRMPGAPLDARDRILAAMAASLDGGRCLIATGARMQPQPVADSAVVNLHVTVVVEGMRLAPDTQLTRMGKLELAGLPGCFLRLVGHTSISCDGSGVLPDQSRQLARLAHPADLQTSASVTQASRSVK